MRGVHDGRRQLIVYRAFYGPEVTSYAEGGSYPERAGVGCSWHGTNAVVREGDRSFRSSFITARGDEQLGSTWNYLEITGLGRQEEWEDSPEGYPQTPPYGWWNCHHAYIESR